MFLKAALFECFFLCAMFSRISHIICLYAFLNGGLSWASVDPLAAVVEVGQNALINCYSNDDKTNLSWRLPSGEVLPPQHSFNDRIHNAGGVLNISAVAISDSGIYYCLGSQTNFGESLLKVYEMPSYRLDLFILTVLSIVLFVVFIVSSVFRHLKQRKLDQLTLKETSEVPI